MQVATDCVVHGENGFSNYSASFNRCMRRAGTEVFEFFLNLEKTLTDAEEFKRKWSTLPFYNLEPSALSSILHNTAVHLANKQDLETERECLHFVSENIHIWNEEMAMWESEADTHDLALSLWSCAILHALGPDKTFEPAGKEIYMALARRETPEKTPVQQRISDACAAFDFKPLCEPPSRRNLRSFFEDKLALDVQAVYGARMDRQWMVPRLNHRPDITVHGTPGANRDIAIEFDGPTHFNGTVINPHTHQREPRYNTKTLFRAWLMQHVSPKTIGLHVPFELEQELKHGDNGVKMMEAFVRKAGARDSGCWVALSNRGFFIRPMLPGGEEKSLTV